MNLFDECNWSPSRVLCWFSCGVTSAVACKLALAENPDARVVRIVLAGEHADSDRFADECGRWFRRPITNIRAAKYADHFQVIAGERYINGPSGAKCTQKLKREVREKYQRAGDLHVFGFDAAEADRVADFRENNPGLPLLAPLIDAGLSKADCKAIVGRAGIELPAMYRLGYANNNCVGCVKGGGRLLEPHPRRLPRRVRPHGRHGTGDRGDRLAKEWGEVVPRPARPVGRAVRRRPAGRLRAAVPGCTSTGRAGRGAGAVCELTARAGGVRGSR